MTYWGAFYDLRLFVFWFKLHPSLFPMIHLTISQHYFIVLCHHHSQWAPGPLRHICHHSPILQLLINIAVQLGNSAGFRTAYIFCMASISHEICKPFWLTFGTLCVWINSCDLFNSPIFHWSYFTVTQMPVKLLWTNILKSLYQNHNQTLQSVNRIHKSWEYSVWYRTLKRKCCHFDEIFIAGCIGSCHFDNFRCSQWWKFHQNEGISVYQLIFAHAVWFVGLFMS